MKKIACLIFALALLALCACGGKAEATETPGVPSAAPTAASTPEDVCALPTAPPATPSLAPPSEAPGAAADTHDYAPYFAVLEKYYAAFSSAAGADVLEGLNGNVPFFQKRSTLGYAMRDVNGDGIKELIIAPTDGSMYIYDMYTLSNGECVKLLEGNSRGSVYTLCVGGTVGAELSVNGDSFCLKTYRIEDAALVCEQCVVYNADEYDPATVPGAPWHTGTDIPEDGDLSAMTEISEEEGLAMVAAMREAYTAISYAPLSTLH